MRARQVSNYADDYNHRSDSSSSHSAAGGINGKYMDMFDFDFHVNLQLCTSVYTPVVDNLSCCCVHAFKRVLSVFLVALMQTPPRKKIPRRSGFIKASSSPKIVQV
jgi:hypothetical protein